MLSYIRIGSMHPEAWAPSPTRHHQEQQPTAFDRCLGTALQVLSNPERRQVYDIYGKEGLVAGLQVGPSQRSTDDLRQDWERFKAQQVECASLSARSIEDQEVLLLAGTLLLAWAAQMSRLAWHVVPAWVMLYLGILAYRLG